jgi:glycerol-3-phosphate dehydrogenase
MKRKDMLAQISTDKVWDVIVIGGGATGVGIALDASSRGYATLLLERGDFSQGTSSRSTKLVHGGVRYLQQGNIALVLEALKERGVLRRNAPHLVFDLPFIVPNYDWWEGPFYGIGLKLYDMLAGKEGFGPSVIKSKEETLALLPTIETEGLNGGVQYHDGQFDDARLVINLAQTAVEQGAVMMNYMPVIGFSRKDGLINGVVAEDLESNTEFAIQGKVVINATGPFADLIRDLDDPQSVPMIAHSQGVHIVLDKAFLPGNTAIMVPHTDDGRVLFAIPWHNKVLVGTTDTPLDTCEVEPKPLPEEIEFLLVHAARYLTKDPTEADVLSMFAGVRPLVTNPEAENTAAISREHVVSISKSGLVTIAGGKWTTYRKMAEDTVEQALLVGGLDPRPCVTADLQVHGYHLHTENFGALAFYGADAVEIQNLVKHNPELGERLHPDLDIIRAEVVWAVQEEMAMDVSDFLSRRTRAILLDARASIEMAPEVAAIMAKELKKSRSWKKDQVRLYTELASNYIIP